MQSANVDLAQNLRLLCDYEKSVSAVCRAIGVNRQQFSKYLNATSRPSPYNLQRICEHFGVRTADLLLPHDEFSDRMQFRPDPTGGLISAQKRSALSDAFPGDRQALRRYLGYYLTHYHSFSWDGYVLRAVTYVYEEDGLILAKTIERTRDPHDDVLYLSKYNGQLSLLGNRIFVVEHQALANDAIVETVLYPDARSQLTLLRGVTFGLSSKQRNPYVSRCVWKYLGTNVDQRRVLHATGLISRGSNQVDPKIMRILGDNPFPNELLHYDLEQPGQASS